MSWYPSEKSEACLFTNTAGFSFESFPCLYGDTLGKTYFEWEKAHDPVYVRDWMVSNPWCPLLAVTLYGVFCTAGKSYFNSRPAWNWRSSMALWNLGLSVFSAMGFARTAPQLLHNLYHYGMTENLCFDPESNFGSGATGFWVQMFCLSKFPELLDTFFIVIHKKPLILLHWYHHISVLLYCWHAYVTKAPAGLFFVSMNYGVHAIMYFYYFLMAIKLKPKWFNSSWITVTQISQMVVGVAVTALGFILTPTYAGECGIKPENNAAALIMYGSYLLLFVQFFIQRYQLTSGKSKSKTKAVKKE